MTQPWTPIPIDAPLNLNVDPLILPKGALALENCYINEAAAHVRFPGLTPFAQLPDAGNVYVGANYDGDLICATSLGRIYRVGEDADVTAVQGASVEGGNRVIFAGTEDRVVMAAGGPIVQYAEVQSSLLSPNAPLASHVAFIDSYLIANEIGSERYHYSDPGDYTSWQPLNVEAADSRPTDVSALHVTPYREVLIAAHDRIEQWERLLTGDIPFFRRWTVGEGVRAPYTIVSADNAAFCINRDHEFIRFAGQAAQPASVEIQKVLDAVDNWDGAWVGGHPDRALTIAGQRFLLLQIPNATNPYGTKGLTFALDIRQKRWLNLYGWDVARNLPARWPGWSYRPIWDKVVGGGPAGALYLLDPANYTLGRRHAEDARPHRPYVERGRDQDRCRAHAVEAWRRADLRAGAEVPLPLQPRQRALVALAGARHREGRRRFPLCAFRVVRHRDLLLVRMGNYGRM